MAKYKMEDLKKKYGGFLTPYFSIKINGKDLAEGNEVIIESVEVELTAGYESSIASIVISHIFDITTMEFIEELEKTIKIGSEVIISLGYGKLTQVFKGIITTSEIYSDRETPLQLMLECMDVKAIMMNSLKSELKKDMKKYSDVVKAVLKDYNSFIDKQVIDTTKEISMPVEQHGQSDYEFIIDIAKKINYEFYIINGEVHFTEIGKDKTSLIELKYGDDIIEFSRSVSLNDQFIEVTVKGNNEEDPSKPFEHTAKSIKTIGKGSKGAKELAKVFTKTAKKTIIDTSIGSKEEAKIRAEAELMKISLKLSKGEIKILGLPEIVPGKFITLKGLGKNFDGDYYVLKTTHKVYQGTYYTILNVGVNKI